MKNLRKKIKIINQYEDKTEFFKDLLVKAFIKLRINSFFKGLIEYLNKTISNEYRESIEILEYFYSKNIKFRKYKKYTVVDYPDTKDLVKIALRVKSSDFLVLKQIFINQEYFSIVTILNKYNIKPSVIIDCGANIGLTSLYLKNQYPLTTIICIEPDRSNVSSIRENILLNNYKGLSVLEKGIWKENKILYLHSDFRDGRDWAYTLNENISPIKIETVTIANLISLFNIREIDFLKIDIEGSEKELFLDKEIENWLSITNVIAIEIHDEFNCRADILSILAQFDFEISYSGELVIGVNKKLRYKQ